MAIVSCRWRSGFKERLDVRKLVWSMVPRFLVIANDRHQMRALFLWIERAPPFNSQVASLDTEDHPR